MADVLSRLYDCGFSFIPVDPNGKRPGISEGQMYGVTSCTRDRDKIAVWLGNGMKLGCVGGEIQREMPIRHYLVVIDADVKRENGLDTLKKLEEEYGELPETLTIKSPSGGKHFYYLSQRRIGSTSDAFRQKFGQPSGVDIKGHHGYVVCPPSEGYDVEVNVAPATLSSEWSMFLDSVVGGWHRQEKKGETFSVPPSPVVEAFNKRSTIRKALEDFGYVKDGKNSYHHPFGATTNASVVIRPKEGLLKNGSDEVSFHFGANDKITGGPHDAFDVYRLLRHDGSWTEAIKDVERELAPKRKKENHIYFANAVTRVTRMELIDQHIREEDVCLLAGFSETMKTFWAMDMCFSLATELPFLGKFQVRKGGADSVMVLTESRVDYNDRLDAWLKFRSQQFNVDEGELRKKLDRIITYFYPVVLDDPDSVQDFNEARDELFFTHGRKPTSPKLWVLDHFSNNYRGETENDNAQVASYLGAVRLKCYEEGVAVAILHHPPKSGESKTRGAACLVNNVPLVYSFDRDKRTKVNPVQVSQHKCSYFNGYKDYFLKPNYVDLHMDETRVRPQLRTGLVLTVADGIFKDSDTEGASSEDAGQEKIKDGIMLAGLSPVIEVTSQGLANIMGTTKQAALTRAHRLEDEGLVISSDNPKGGLFWRLAE